MNPINTKSINTGSAPSSAPASTPSSETSSTGAVRSCLYPTSPDGFPLRFDLLASNTVASRRMAATYGEGFLKYGANNWMKGFPQSVLITHHDEHMRCYAAGDRSEDHLAHARWNLDTLMWVEENKPELLDNDIALVESGIGFMGTKFRYVPTPKDITPMTGAKRARKPVAIQAAWTCPDCSYINYLTNDVCWHCNCAVEPSVPV